MLLIIRRRLVCAAAVSGSPPPLLAMGIGCWHQPPGVPLGWQVDESFE